VGDTGRKFPNKHELGLLKISIRELARMGLWRSKWLTVTLSLALCVGQRDKRTRQGGNHDGNQQSLDVRSTWAREASRFARIPASNNAMCINDEALRGLLQPKNVWLMWAMWRSSVTRS
jgi:hypothetical protein